MEQFSVEAYLKATDSNFGSTFSAAMDQVKEFQDNTKSTMSTVGGIMTSAGKTMTKAVTLPILGLTTAAVKVGGDFEEQMSRVKAISGATGDAFEELRDQAIDLGAKTAFSAKESADGMENLASAGFDAQEIMAAMPGLLDLAAVSGGDVALASENAATALRGFGLEADQSGHIADVFARAAADTNAEVADMGEAMKYIAPVANAMGLSIEETAAAIGIMSDAGVKGSQAGTTLRGALSRISKPTKAMRETMDELGISFYDSEGNMISLQDQISLLSGSFDGLTQEQKNQALVTLYGQESLSGMMALIDKGPDSLGALTESLEQSDGAADEMARTMQDNMNSSIEQMMGALESAAIVIQDILAPAISAVADYIGGLAEKFVSAPKWMQTAIITFGLLAAAIGPVLLVVGAFILKLQDFKIGLAIIRSDFPKLGKVISGLMSPLKSLFGIIAANPIILLVAAIVAAVAAFIYFWNTSEEFRNFWIGLWESIKETFYAAWETMKTALLAVWDTIIALLTPIVVSVMEIFSPMITFFIGLWEQIKTIAGAAWELIKAVIMAPVLLLIDLVTGDFNRFKEDLSMIWTTIKDSISTIVLAVVKIVIGYFKAIFDTGKNIFNGLKDFFSGIWGSIKETASNAWQSIKDTASRIWGDMVDGVSNLVNDIFGWFDKIKDIDLLEAGRAIIDSFLKGLKEKYEGVKDFIGGIGDWIRDHKGPIRVDRKLLIPAGNAIMEGLNNGLDNGFGAVQDNVSSMGDRLSTNFDIGSRLTSINSQIQTKVQHEVSYGANNKPAVFNVRIGNSEFSAFLDDISQARGNEINLNMQF
ncbi:phage tail tape measure protein [Enterococcus casseliflavus]|uniref:phage tail tape measure protein n=1 Tax=Enterococcus casseliflavus TaxID=37734 RepID=UPI0029557685|nr:phage tail tape measure protein [Enterococcus casseliflavus]MDV7688781.1 phage tail tape measure protein [Enterococcus casseliflavus]